jgi:hypothetical protein
VDAKEHPIPFCGEMVRAILAGRKTVTRRVIRPSKHKATGVRIRDGVAYNLFAKKLQSEDDVWHALLRLPWPIRCPYGTAGDVLWVRETWRQDGTHIGSNGLPMVRHRVGGQLAGEVDAAWFAEKSGLLPLHDKWRPSIHMPRWACRLRLTNEGVRPERIRDITEEEIVAEGVQSGSRKEFRELWDEINARRGFGWKVNPPVWRVAFSVRVVMGRRF